MNRLPMFAVVLLAVSLLALATFSVGPVLMGSGPLDFNDFMPLIVASLAGTLACFGWLALARAVPTRQWLVALGLVSAWCLVIGLLTLASNASGAGHWETSLRDAEERAEQLRSPNATDSKGEALSAESVRKQLDGLNDEIRLAREGRNYKKLGVYLSLGMTLVGLVAAGKFALLFRQRARAA